MVDGARAEPAPSRLAAIADAQITEARELLAQLADAPRKDPSRPEHQRTESDLMEGVGRGLEAIDAWLAEDPTTSQVDVLEALHRSLRRAEVLARETRHESVIVDADIERRIRATKRYVFLALAVVALVAGTGLILVFRTVLAPIKTLRESALRLRKGELGHRIRVTRQDEIADLGRAFNSMADELGRSHAELAGKVEARTRDLVRAARLADVGVLAAGVAHEINNPLASIASCGEALLKRKDLGSSDPAESREYLETIVSEAYRARGITTRLLNLARADSNELARVDVHALFSQAALLTRHLLAEKRLELEVALEAGLSAIEGNAGELLQVLVNLILNARDASPPGERIRLVARQEGGTQVWEVEDNGEGIAPTNVERIFDPFFTTKGPGAGTGLGLSLVAAIVGRHGGSIEAGAGVTGGARFTVRLPSSEKAA
jgi:signal transduction histidine kinase